MKHIPKVFSRLSGDVAMATFLLAVLFATALRPTYKYIGSIWIWALYVIVAVGLLYLVTTVAGFRQRILENSVPALVLAAIYGLLNLLFYPLADGLKTELQGQDQDDCTIIVSEQLLKLDFPYDQTSYFGNPCSPLFGALVPYIPFVAFDAFLLANSAIIIVSVVLVFWLSSSKSVASLGTLIAIGIPQTLELLVNGSDFIFMGWGLLILGLCMRRIQRDSRFLLLATILVGVLASTRISMPILGIAYVGFLWVSVGRRRALGHSALAATVAILPSGILFLWSPADFSPLHLVAKGQRLVPGFFYVLMAAITLLAIIWAIRNLNKRIEPLGFLIATMVPHLLFLSFGDLVFNRRMDFYWWEGASYLMVITPLAGYFVAEVILNETKSNSPQLRVQSME